MRTGEAERLASLRTQIRSVRDEIVSILARMDDITLQQLPSIRADYALRIGCWEQALLEAERGLVRARQELSGEY